VTAAQRFLVPKITPQASKSRNSLLNSLIAGKSHGDGRDQHCVASQAVRKPEKVSLKGEKGPLLGGFGNSAPVSELPNRKTCRLFREKSPATTANIPIFGRLSLETRFDSHCARDAAVAFSIFSDTHRASWGTPVLNCRLTVPGVRIRFAQPAHPRAPNLRAKPLAIRDVISWRAGGRFQRRRHWVTSQIQDLSSN
jgi:hypothetical protein